MTIHRFLRLALGCLLVATVTPAAFAITTSGGQAWDFVPDAWTRGNTADTSYFGWDVIESAGSPGGPFGSGRLDDSTPDLGSPTTASSPRIVQSTASLAIYGHRSGSTNYYSGFPDNAFADDAFSAIAPAGGSGGFTTVVLQVIGQPANGVNDLSFSTDNSSVTWTRQKDLYAKNASGAGVYWQEWTAPGDHLPFSIHMASASSSIGLDAFQIDTFWSAAGPVVNAIAAIPEPSCLALSAAGLLGLARIAGRRRSIAGNR